MPSQGDIIQITHNQNFLDQACANIYHYECSFTEIPFLTPEQIVDSLLNWESQWELTIGNIVVNNLSTTTLIYDNLTNPNEFGIAEGVKNGVRVGTADDSISAIGWKLLNDQRVIRPGQKRFAGVPEDYTSGNTVTIPADEINLCKSFLAGGIAIDIDNDTAPEFSLQPVVLGRTKDANGRYRIDLNKVARITAAELNPFVTSQVSRKQRLT